jgi:hypothetical protein
MWPHVASLSINQISTEAHEANKEKSLILCPHEFRAGDDTNGIPPFIFVLFVPFCNTELARSHELRYGFSGISI